MIIEFKVSNFKSIYKQQTFSMVAGPGSELKDNCYNADCDGNLQLVRAAVMYGANASGKSNFLSALLTMRKIIMLSAKESQQGEELPMDSFAFDESRSNEPSEFAVTFIKEKIRYQYGFAANKNRITEEWLFAYPLGKAQRWFSRVYVVKDEKDSWSFSKFFKGGKKVADLTRGNILFLSNAVKLNNEQLAPIFDWFQKDMLFIDSPSKWGTDSRRSEDLLKTEDGKKRVLQLMLAADASINDVSLEEKTSEEHYLELFKHIPQKWQETLKQQKIFSINFTHTEKNISLELKNESAGTRKLLDYAGYWIDVLDNGRILIVDELDNSLHPLLVRLLIKLISNPEINKKNAQLIFSTHDTSLLDNEIFRRDQIWFLERDKTHSTQLYSLLEFSPRKNEAIGKGYLQGRYGALPLYVNEWRF